MPVTSFEPDFRVTVTTGEPDGPVIAVRGELDSGTCEELLTAFQSTLAEHREGRITLDLSEVTFIDSAGTRMVIMLERNARDRAISFVVVAPANEVTELLRTAGVIEHFELTPRDWRGGIGAGSVLERVELELSSDPQSPAQARAEVRELLADRDQTQVGDVVLLTSEIVTNAVVHPEPAPEATIGLRMFTYADGIRVEVDDSGDGFDPSVPMRPQPDRGRGLFLVDRFASRWGTERVQADPHPRFMVWFELDWDRHRTVETPSA